MKKFKLVVNIILLIILVPILIVSSILIIRSYTDKENVPSIFGKTPLIVLSGSMEPTIKTGDVVIVDNINEEKPNKNDVIAFFSDYNKKTVITHRIVDIQEEDGKTVYVTKGDANNANDSDVVYEDLVIGIYNNVRIQGLGNVAVFLQTTTGISIVISIPILIILLSQFMDNRKTKKELENLKKSKEE